MSVTVADGSSVLQELEETIVLNELLNQADDPETLQSYIGNQHLYQSWLGKYGVADQNDMVRINVRAKNTSNPEADPAFEAYCSTGGGFMFITYMNRDPANTDNIYAANHPPRRRVHMSEWIHRGWKLAAQQAGHAAEAPLPPLGEVVFANVVNVEASAAVESMRLRTHEREGEVCRRDAHAVFEKWLAMPLLKTVMHVLINMPNAFREHVPGRIAWRSGDGCYIGEGHGNNEFELEDRFLVVSLRPMTRQRKTEVHAALRAEGQQNQQQADAPA
ncbi:uncharacterized protein PpBr36_09951 [Pyricularia pennisetigena]|uniref:uncharacterized protein n=1 Tax=Pyricularia pennisetigena TaxID=1578925 RepID=UPI00115088E2|nr:uncharacterized protein PpBr36_09951 [Pyricularia pennisetigena]TLS22300.1 hypothetical protein PpBr36_09951 [Pyricularia pennisetigena]